MKLIDKDKVVAEIERIRTYYEKLQMIKQVYNGHIDNCNDLLDFLDTLEVKEVDLEKEFYDFLDTLIGKDNGHLSKDELFRIAEYFYELGLKLSNPITAADKGMAEEIIINLKHIEQDYHIDLTKEMQWLRNIVKKGE